MDDQYKTKEQLINELTELRQQMTELEKSEERYRSLVESVRDLIYAVSLDGTLTSLNPAFENVTGWSCTEWIGKPLSSLVDPDDWPLAVEMFECMMRGETPPIHEVRVCKKSGGSFIGEFTITPDIEHGKVVGVLGVGRDITMRKRAEEVLRESEAKYRTLVGRLQEGVYQSDIEGNYITLNQAGVEIFGFDFPEQIVGKLKTANLYVDVSERAEIIEEIRRTGSSLREVQARKRDGTIIWLLVNNNVRRDEAGNIVGYEGVFSDITGRKRAEEALRQSEEKYRVLINNIPDVTWTTDREGHTIFDKPPC